MDCNVWINALARLLNEMAPEGMRVYRQPSGAVRIYVDPTWYTDVEPTHPDAVVLMFESMASELTGENYSVGA